MLSACLSGHFFSCMSGTPPAPARAAHTPLTLPYLSLPSAALHGAMDAAPHSAAAKALLRLPPGAASSCLERAQKLKDNLMLYTFTAGMSIGGGGGGGLGGGGGGAPAGLAGGGGACPGAMARPGLARHSTSEIVLDMLGGGGGEA